MRTPRSSASASRSISTTFPEGAPAPGPLRASGGLRRGRGAQPRDAYQRRREHVPESEMTELVREHRLDFGVRELLEERIEEHDALVAADAREVGVAVGRATRAVDDEYSA